MKNPLLYPTRRFGAAAVILLICAGLVYWELGEGISSEEGFVWDEQLMLALHSLSQPWLDKLFLAITRSGDILLVLPIVAMFIYLWRRSEKTTAVLLVVSAVIYPLVSLVVKEQFGRPRPEVFPPLVIEDTFSFPSGHTLTAVGVYGFIAVLLWQRGHRLLATLSGIWVFVIALSRVYLGAHYPSDVLASLALGTIMLIIMLYIDKRLTAIAST
jgi:membrane-associated phospholipid phosphatase